MENLVPNLYITNNKKTNMPSIMITGKDKKEMDALILLAEKIGAEVHPLNSDQTEDILLGDLMTKTRTNKMISRDAVMKKLLPKK